MKIKQALLAVLFGLIVLVTFIIELDMVWRWWHGRETILWSLAGLCNTGMVIVMYRDSLVKWFSTDNG